MEQQMLKEILTTVQMMSVKLDETSRKVDENSKKLRQEFKTDIEKLRQEFKADIQKQKKEQTEETHRLMDQQKKEILEETHRLMGQQTKEISQEIRELSKSVSRKAIEREKNNDKRFKICENNHKMNEVRIEKLEIAIN